MDKDYNPAERPNWVTLNCTMFTFGILLLIQLVWVNLSFEFSLAYRVVSFVDYYTRVGHSDNLLALRFNNEQYERLASRAVTKILEKVPNAP